MAKAYSDDLRRKLIKAHQQGEGSLEVLAQRFHVSVGWAQVKQQLRSAKARSLAALETCLADALAAVTPHHMQACFRHCGYEL